MIEAPVLNTEFLVLLPVQLDDFEPLAAMLASPRAAGVGGPYGRAAAWGLFCHDIACWSLFGHGALMVTLRGSGECVGQVSINHGPLFPEKELGWMAYDGHQGRGYITEAARALRDWGQASGVVPSLVSYMDPANARSIAVAERLGATRDPHAILADPTDIAYRDY